MGIFHDRPEVDQPENRPEKSVAVSGSNSMLSFLVPEPMFEVPTRFAGSGPRASAPRPKRAPEQRHTVRIQTLGARSRANFRSTDNFAQAMGDPQDRHVVESLPPDAPNAELSHGGRGRAVSRCGGASWMRCSWRSSPRASSPAATPPRFSTAGP